MKEMEPIAVFRSPFTSKFGIPRQSGLVEDLPGRIVFAPEYRSAGAFRGLEGFDYIWIIWGFSANAARAGRSTVRPPRLGGNRRVGVFATRSPFRPNGLGLSSVRVVSVGDGFVEVLGADLMDGTPVYDVKPYVPYTDSHPDARAGFVDENEWMRLEVIMPAPVRKMLTPVEFRALAGALSLDPRPHYHEDPQRIYAMPFGGKEIRFRVEEGRLHVLEIVGACENRKTEP